MNGPANTYMAALKTYKDGAFVIPEDRVIGQKPDPNDPVFQSYKADILKMAADAGRAYTIEEFSRFAQMINYENHKGLFEALTARRSNGLLMWMSQSSWPSLMWQTYDWYLDTNAGYFGAKAGCQPTHAVWDPRSDEMILSNATPRAYQHVKTALTLYDLQGKPVLTKEYETAELAADSYGLALGSIDFSASPTDMVFIKLIVYDETCTTLGENFYWHNRKDYQDYRALNELPKADVRLRVTGKEELPGGRVVYTLALSNESSTPAVQVRIRAHDILPAFYSDNYFALMPGDEKNVTVEMRVKQLNGREPNFTLSGWNTNALSS
jgi:hypothetical protein